MAKNASEYYVIIEHDIQSGQISVLHITNDYTNAISNFKDSYVDYVNDDLHIVREIEKNFIHVYKRNIGMLWNSKSPLKNYKLCKCEMNKKITS
jgi:hypothetical protein